MKIGILTSGGDCPGLNAVIRGAVLQGRHLARRRVRRLPLGLEGRRRGRHHADRAATTCAASRSRAARSSARAAPTRSRARAAAPRTSSGCSTRNGIDAIIAIGGEGTLTAARRLTDEGLKIVGVPKTIDNDLAATDYSFGFDTAVEIATEAIDRLRTTADSHGRCMVVEVMGRHVGWIALHSGMAGGAHAILIPEQPQSIEQICEWVESVRDRGRAPLDRRRRGLPPRRHGGGALAARASTRSTGRASAASPSGSRPIIEERTGIESRDDRARPHPARRRPVGVRPRARDPARHGGGRRRATRARGARWSRSAAPTSRRSRSPRRWAASTACRSAATTRRRSSSADGCRCPRSASATSCASGRASWRCSSAARSTASAWATSSASAASSNRGSRRWTPPCARCSRNRASSSRHPTSSRVAGSPTTSRIARRGARSRTCSSAASWRGEPSGSDELDPEWFALDAVPFDEMWDDARRWLPGVLAGGRVRRTFVFGEDLATVVAERESVA